MFMTHIHGVEYALFISAKVAMAAHTFLVPKCAPLIQLVCRHGSSIRPLKRPSMFDRSCLESALVSSYLWQNTSDWERQRVVKRFSDNAS
jgi:hypothetical protein